MTLKTGYRLFFLAIIAAAGLQLVTATSPFGVLLWAVCTLTLWCWNQQERSWEAEEQARLDARFRQEYARHAKARRRWRDPMSVEVVCYDIDELGLPEIVSKAGELEDGGEIELLDGDSLRFATLTRHGQVMRLSLFSQAWCAKAPVEE